MDAYRQFVDAAEKKDAATLVRIIHEHPELHSHEEDDGTLLDIIRNSFPEFFETAFAAGLHPDSGRPCPHQTLLQRAVSDSDPRLVALCIGYGADIERRNCEGETALGYAAAWASLEIVKALLDAGADVNAIEGMSETGFSTAYDAACSTNPEHGRAEIRELLRQHGGKGYGELTAK
jgi:hypothetical protein